MATIGAERARDTAKHGSKRWRQVSRDRWMYLFMLPGLN